MKPPTKLQLPDDRIFNELKLSSSEFTASFIKKVGANRERALSALILAGLACAYRRVSIKDTGIEAFLFNGFAVVELLESGSLSSWSGSNLWSESEAGSIGLRYSIGPVFHEKCPMEIKSKVMQIIGFDPPEHDAMKSLEIPLFDIPSSSPQ